MMDILSTVDTEVWVIIGYVVVNFLLPNSVTQYTEFVGKFLQITAKTPSGVGIRDNGAKPN